MLINTTAGIILALILCAGCSQRVHEAIIYDAAKMDSGYVYEYRGSVNPRQFTENGSKVYVYSMPEDSIELLYEWTDDYATGLLRETTIIMDMQQCLKKSIAVHTYLAVNHTISPAVKFDYKSVITYDFERSIMTKDEYWVDGRKPETITHPLHDASSVGFDPKTVPVFDFFDMFPIDLFIAGRFLDENTTSLLPINERGYHTYAYFVPEKRETFSYNGTSYVCRAFTIRKKGLTAKLFDKPKSFLRETDSGFQYPVCFKEGEIEYRLASRTAMKPDEWEAFKQKIKDEFSPEGYLEIDYEE